MKKYLVLATVFLMSSYADAATMTWYGSAGWRYSKSTVNDGTNNKGISGTINESTSERTEKAHMFRGQLGATGGWDNVEWGIGVRTTGTALLNNPSGTMNTDWTNTAGADFGIGLENAWFKYGNDWGFGDIGVTFGRQAAAFATGRNQAFIDNDVRFNGISETWQWGSFGLNFGQYILGAVSNGTAGNSSYVETPFSSKLPGSHGAFSVLYSFQPTFKWKFSDELAAFFAVGYHKWSNAIGTTFQNRIPNGGTTGFGTAAANMTANSTGVYANAVSQENSKHWQFLMNWQLPFMLSLDFEYIFNKDQVYAVPKSPGGNDNFPAEKVNQSKDAWAASLAYGQLKKAHDFMISYAFHDKGIGSVHNAFSYDKVQAGLQAHEITAAYNIANNFHVMGKWFSMKEKNGRNQLGVEPRDVRRLENDMWEISTGVKF